MEFTEEKIIELVKKALEIDSETLNVEFKDGRGGFGKNVWKTISSFSNSAEGGLIVYGITDRDGATKVTGGIDIANLQHRITSFMREEMENTLDPEIRIFDLEGESLLVVVVNPVSNEKKPCYYKTRGLPQGACIRIGNIDQEISFDQVKSFLRDATPFKFDVEAVGSSTPEDLSREAIGAFLEKSAKRVSGRRSDPEDDYTSVLLNLRLLANHKDKVVPSIAGVLIFSKNDPQLSPNFSRYIIRCVRYAGDTVSSPIIDRAEVSGTLGSQIDGVHLFIIKNIPVSARLVGTKMVETYSYPEDAIREVVANAVVHRDYQITETYTQVNVFSNRIEVTNAGNLAPGISIENIKDAQFSRNEVIAATLRDMNYLEEYGRGIDLIYDQMKEWGLLDPLFRNSVNSFKVTLLGESFSNLTPSQVVIWQALHESDRMTAQELVSLFDGRSRQSVTLDLKGLLEEGLISREGSGSGVYYRSKY